AARADFSSGEPGSVTATIRRLISAGPSPSPANAFSYTRRWLSVSMVVPLLLDTTSSVPPSRSPSTPAVWCGSVGSSTLSGARAPLSAAPRGARRRAAQAGQHHGLGPAGGGPAGELGDLGQQRAGPLVGPQPAEPDRRLGLGGGSPHPRVSGGQGRGHPGRG